MNQKAGFVETIRNMFVGVVRPGAYMRNGVYSRMGYAFLAVFLINILLYLIIFFLPYNKLFGGGRLADKVDSAIGDFVLSEDGFSYDGTFEYSDDEGLSYIRIDTSEDKCDSAEAKTLASENGYSTVVIVSSQEAVAYRSGSASTLRCKDIYGVLNEAHAQSSYSKQDILELIEKWDTPVLAVAYIFEIVVGMLNTLLWSLVAAAIGLIAASSKKKNLTLGNAFKASIYIRLIWYPVLMIIGTYLVPAKTFLGFAALVISVIYICLAVKKFIPDMPEDMQPAVDIAADGIGGYSADSLPSPANDDEKI